MGWQSGKSPPWWGTSIPEPCCPPWGGQVPGSGVCCRVGPPGCPGARSKPGLLSATKESIGLESRKALGSHRCALGPLPELAGSWQPLFSMELSVQHRRGQGHSRGTPELRGGRMLLQALAGFS